MKTSNDPRAGRIAGATLLLASLGACGTSNSPTSAATKAPGAPGASTPAAAAGVLPTGDTPVTLDPANFSTTIDNPYWPMKPGTRMTYRDTSGGADRKVVLVVTDRTQVMPNGVNGRVVRDTVYEGGEIVEDTIDWYAQDAQGNVWYLGEDTAEMSHGKITSRHGSFQAGAGGAQAGIAIPAAPAAGMRYRQEFLRGEAEDNGEVLSTAELVSAPAGKYRDALLTRDTSTIEPDVSQLKFYARGVGPVLSLGVAGEAAREELVSVDSAPAKAATGPLGSPDA